MAKLPKFEDWKAPWEIKEEDFDEDAAKRYIYTLSSDKEKLQERVATANTERDEANTKVTETQKELDAALANGPDAEAVTKAQAATAAAEDRAKKAELKALQYEVAADKDVPLKQAKRLQGATKEELEADAEEFVQSFGSTGTNTADEDEDDDEDNGVPRRTPRRLVNPNDSGGAGGDSEVVDFDKVIAGIPRL